MGQDVGRQGGKAAAGSGTRAGHWLRAWAPFALAVLVWIVTTFPAIHLRQLQVRHHLAGSLGAHPALFAAYVRHALRNTALLGLLGPALLWAVPRRFKRDGAEVFAWSIGIGVASALALLALTAAEFRLVSDRILPAVPFIYAGVVAGIVAGEIHRRALRRAADDARTPDDRRREFRVAALLAWAVLLAIPAGVVLATAQPGDPVLSPHFAMWLSVALWTPWVAGRFWKWVPRSLATSVARSALAGVVLPLLVCTVLFVPAMILFYAGMLWPYQMTWAAVMVFSGVRPWGPLLYVAIGAAWGVAVGVLRWRDRGAAALPA